MGAWANDILNTGLPAVAREALFADKHDLAALASHCTSVEDQDELRASLAAQGLVAFVANGSLLPRATGASDTPMAGENVVLFQSPASLEVTLQLKSGQASVSNNSATPFLPRIRSTVPWVASLKGAGG